jgi:hypothetical protein
MSISKTNNGIEFIFNNNIINNTRRGDGESFFTFDEKSNLTKINFDGYGIIQLKKDEFEKSFIAVITDEKIQNLLNLTCSIDENGDVFGIDDYLGKIEEIICKIKDILNE